MPLPSPLISQKVSEQNFEIAILFSIAERQITLHLKMTRPSTASVEGSSSYEFCQFLCTVFVIGKCAFIFRVGGANFPKENFILGWFVRIPLRSLHISCFLFCRLNFTDGDVRGNFPWIFTRIALCRESNRGEELFFRGFGGSFLGIIGKTIRKWIFKKQVF